MKNFLRLNFLVAVLFGGWPSAFSQAVEPISPKDTTVLVQSVKALLVDVREKDELAEGMLAGAKLEAEGFDVRNLGGFADARDAGMKTTRPGQN